MVALKLSVPTTELAARMRARLCGAKGETPGSIVWEQDGERVLLLVSSLTVRTVDGWLLCSLDVQTDQTGKQSLQFVYFIGEATAGNGLQAAATINAPDLTKAQLADRFGSRLQAVLWDAVLDVIEASVQKAAKDKPGEPLLVGGFHCDATHVSVDVLVGAV